jgi:hypothetical protein
METSNAFVTSSNTINQSKPRFRHDLQLACQLVVGPWVEFELPIQPRDPTLVDSDPVFTPLSPMILYPKHPSQGTYQNQPVCLESKFAAFLDKFHESNGLPSHGLVVGKDNLVRCDDYQVHHVGSVTIYLLRNV